MVRDMKRHFVLVAAMFLGTVGMAQGAPRTTIKWTDPSRMGATYEAPAPANVSHVIFMNRCTGGCTLHPGNDNSLTDTSSIPNGTSSVSQYAGTAAQWQQLVSCVRATYAPFNVQIVDQRPASGNYHMAVVAGRASEVGEQQGVLGVSPFSCGYIGNAISFTFANEEPSNINDLCWTVSQETAHSWGLDHKFDNRDPMTYLQSGPAMKTFQNQAGSCGEYSARTCSCTYAGTGNSQENSFALVMATFGSSAPDVTPPTVTITSPANNGSVMPGFAVRADVNDDIAVQKAEMRLDGTLTSTVMGSPWVWNGPANLSQGNHHVEITAYDLAGNTAKAAIDVAYGQSCTTGGCTDASQVCVDGHCVAGPDSQGGLGTVCTSNAMCASGSCGDDGAGNKFCTSPCDPAMNGCPSGFGCIATGAAGGVCWPGADNGGGGCNTGGSSGAVLCGLGFGAMLITRRRRRK
jgi:hypothetical protein